MELFKLLGTIAINNSEANKALTDTQSKAKETAAGIGKSNEQTKSSNKSTESSWTSLKSKVNEYKAQGMTTSQAWRQASMDMKASSETAGAGIVGAFKKIAVAIGAYLTVTAIVGFGKACLQAAADAQAMESQFSQVFGDLEGKASASLSKVAEQGGISENRLKGSFTKIAAFAKTTGMDTASALNLSERAMIAVADSAAFYDRSIEETTESLQSFLKGNYENDAALGLSCTETTRNAAANKLYGKSFNELSESQKQLTLLQMVEDANKASGALGQAARESDTWSNVLGNLKQGWIDFQAVIGNAILPTAIQVVKGLAEAVSGLAEKTKAAIEWAKEHDTAMQIIGITIATLAVAIGAYNVAINWATISTKLHTAATIIATGATSAFGAVIAFLTSPITLVIAAIGALVAAVVVMYKKFDWFKAIVDTIKAKLVEFGQVALEFLKQKLGEAKEFFQQLGDKAKELWDKMQPVASLIKDSLLTAIDNLKEPVGAIIDSFKMVGDTIFNEVLPALRDQLMPIFEQLKPLIELVGGVIGGVLITALGLMVGTLNGVANAISGFVTMLSGVVQVVSNVFGLIVGIFTGDGEKIKECARGIIDGVINVFGGLWDGVSGFVSGFVDGVVEFFTNLWDTLVGHSIVPDTIDGIVNCFAGLWGKVSGIVSGFVNGVVNFFTGLKDKVVEKATQMKDRAAEKFNALKDKASAAWDSLKTKTTTAFNTAKDKAVNAFNTMKNKVTTAATNIKDKASTAWENLKTKTSSAFSTARDKASSAFSSLKTAVINHATNTASSAGEKFNSMKSKISSAVDGAKSKASSAFSSIKSTISSNVSGAFSTVSSKFNSIKDKISSTMDTAKTKVSNAISTIKSSFNFSWSLPKPKIPHFSVSGGKAPWGFGGQGSLPKISISWYKKAMENAMLLNNPTIFGYSPATGNLLGGGEAGSEVVAGANTLMKMIDSVVATRTSAQNEQIVSVLSAILAAITGGNADILRALLAGQTIRLNEREFARTVREYA